MSQFTTRAHHTLLLSLAEAFRPFFPRLINSPHLSFQVFNRESPYAQLETTIATMKIERLGPDQRQKFRPSLIVVPASVVLQRVEQIDHLFKGKLRVMIFRSWRQNIRNNAQAARTINNWSELRSELNSLGKTSPESGYTVVITSYHTWTRRTTISNKVSAVPSAFICQHRLITRDSSCN